MHPIIPPCPSAEEYRRRSEDWQRRAEKLQDRLSTIYSALEDAETELDRMYAYVRSCDGCRQQTGGGGLEEASSRGRRVRNGTEDDDYLDDYSPTRLRHEHVRGGSVFHSERESTGTLSNNGILETESVDETDREVRHGVGSRRHRSRTRRWRRDQREPSRSEF